MELRLLRYFLAVAEERNVGRAAARLRMTQPPLSRAIRQLERDLGVRLFDRTPKGVEPTEAGVLLHREARTLLDRVDRLPARISAAARTPTIAVGTCADTADQIGSRPVVEFRRRHPEVELSLHETDLTDPTAGLRADVVDVALTRGPFDETGIETRTLRVDPVGVVVPRSDPLAARTSITETELGRRRWNRLPAGTDPHWRAYWRADGDTTTDGEEPPLVRTIQEALQSVLWRNTTTFAPLPQALPDGLVNVPVTDKEPSRLLVAWKRNSASPLVAAFVDIAVACSDR